MSKPTLATWLRRETRLEHHRVDQHPVLKPLLKRELAIEEYAIALSALYAPVASLETALSSGLGAHGVNYPLTQREALLKADILQLGRQVQPVSRLPPLATIESLVGTLYVLEGSRLGGAMIARHVRQVLEDQVLEDQVPRAFLPLPPYKLRNGRRFGYSQRTFAHRRLGLLCGRVLSRPSLILFRGWKRLCMQTQRPKNKRVLACGITPGFITPRSPPVPTAHISAH